MQNRFFLTPFGLDTPSPDLELLASPDWRVNKPVLPEAGLLPRLSALHQPIAEFVQSTAARGERPISIAGDCCTSIGVLAGLQKAGIQPVLLWLDAHGDFNTWETTPSGFIGGMPLAMLAGRGEQALLQAVGMSPFPEDRIILCDARDLDPLEKVALEDSAVHHVTDVISLIDHPLLDNPLYIHLDTDVITPDDAPAMAYRAAGGPGAAQLREVFHALAQTRQVLAVSMTTWSPELDEHGRTRKVCMGLLHSLIGE